MKVYQKENLASSEWTLITNLDGKGHDYVERTLSGDDFNTEVEFMFGKVLDMSSGFFNVEVEQ